MHNVENIEFTIIIILKLTLHGISGDCAWGTHKHTLLPYIHYKKDKYNKQNKKSELNIKMSSKQNKVKHSSSKGKLQES